MRILLTNDDGINALGLRMLAEYLRKAGHQVIIVAPDRERSASSHSISLKKNLRLTRIKEDDYCVDGTPVDCIVVATQKMLIHPVDLVISGINAGQNMGEDVLYSGTVAAALEAGLFGYRAIAISINSYQNQNFDVPASWIVKLLDLGLDNLIPENGILNLNFPNVSSEELRGIRLTRTGHRRYYNFIHIIEELDDGFIYRIGGEAPTWEIETGTDAEAIKENYISITPLGLSLTRGDAFPSILQWLENNNLLQFEISDAL
ncbi:MAG: 5'/3'-nucleotidase SurE [Candidatus Cloacimonetes bacterium]|jgi:5'-nucleotidase|nr:5'/3'-nucleotidase SurE [Candidatus Cloacimonadota bacterium]MDD5624544.1 5'/3'-nucleotidase SurE [Candidatus Cloacimonadota bacterium]